MKSRWALLARGLLVAAMTFGVSGIASALLATPALAKQKVPFGGSLQGVETDTVVGTNILVDGSGAGLATHLGRFTVAWEDTVAQATLSATGAIHLIAANGDSIFTTSVGQANPTDTPNILHIVEIHTIAGGTGRFANVTGSFTVERLLDLATGFTVGSLTGTITSPGAAKR
jgi:hypothetical protein